MEVSESKGVAMVPSELTSSLLVGACWNCALWGPGKAVQGNVSYWRCSKQNCLGICSCWPWRTAGCHAPCYTGESHRSCGNWPLEKLLRCRSLPYKHTIEPLFLSCLSRILSRQTLMSWQQSNLKHSKDPDVSLGSR